MVLFRAQTDSSLTVLLQGKRDEGNSKDKTLDAFSKDIPQRGLDRRQYGPSLINSKQEAQRMKGIIVTHY